MARFKRYTLSNGRKTWMTTQFTDTCGRQVASVSADGVDGLRKVVFHHDASTTDKANVLAACLEWQEARLERLTSENPGHTSRYEQGKIQHLTKREYLGFTVDELTELVRNTAFSQQVEVIDMRYRDIQHAQRCINARQHMKNRARVRITTPYDRWQTRAVVTVTLVDMDRSFEFWNDALMPAGDSDYWCFDVIPTYHPCRQPGRKRTVLINGANGALVSGGGMYVYPPQECRRVSPYDHANGQQGNWDYVLDPVVARGVSFTIEADVDRLLTREGADYVVELVKAALDDTGGYIGISSGFTPPVEYRYPPGAHDNPPTATGAEHQMAWTYHTLQKRGQLAGAYVPSRFLKGDWLRFYASAQGAEVTPLFVS